MLSFLSEVTLCFLSSGLFMCYLPSIDLCLLSHPCISGMKKDFIVASDVFNVSLNWVCNYFVVSVIIWKIGLRFFKNYIYLFVVLSNTSFTK